MPLLAEHFSVVAMDLRGAGFSDCPLDGYDKATMARDAHEVMVALGMNATPRADMTSAEWSPCPRPPPIGRLLPTWCPRRSATWLDRMGGDDRKALPLRLP